MEEARADAKSNRPCRILPTRAGRTYYGLRFTLYESTHGLLNPRFIPAIELNDVVVLLHALVVTLCEQDMIYPYFIHGLQVLIPKTTNRIPLL